MGVPVSDWNPSFFPDEEWAPADAVNLGYVVNVIEDSEERAVALCAAWDLADALGAQSDCERFPVCHLWRVA